MAVKRECIAKNVICRMQWPFPRDWVLKFLYLVPEEGTRSLLPGAKNMWMRVADGIWLAQVLPLQIVKMIGTHVVSCKHRRQDVCMVNEVHKYHSMCEMVESVHAAIETQRRVFC